MILMFHVTIRPFATKPESEVAMRRGWRLRIETCSSFGARVIDDGALDFRFIKPAAQQVLQ